METELLVERTEATALVIFNRPERRNAMTVAMWRRLPSLLADLVADPTVRVIVFRGAGTVAFGAGADISEFPEHRATAAQARQYNHLVGQAIEAIATCPKPTLAMIYGYCIGGACELAIACDLRLAATTAEFAIPAARLGIAISLADLRRLVALVGQAGAKEILLTGRRIPAERALAMGLINAVYPPAELEAATLALAREIAENAPLALRWAKEAINLLLTDPAFSSLPDPEGYVASLFDTADYQEGVRAFLEKRRPRFTGR